MSTSQSLHVAVPPPRHHVLPGMTGPDATLYARLLGEASSARPDHNHDGDVPADGRRCSACRWFTVALYRVDTAGVGTYECEYVVYTAGWSTLPGEVTLPRVQRTTSAHEVIELMTVRNSREGTFFPRPNARVLAQAAAHDAALQDAYVNRVVA